MMQTLTATAFCSSLSLLRRSVAQVRNQLGSPGGAQSFLRRVQIFWTTSDNFNRCPIHFSRGDETFSRRGYGPPALPLVTGLSVHVCMLCWREER